MNNEQFSYQSNTPRGALTINLRAREQEKHLNLVQATWLAENQPSRVQKYSRIRVLFTLLLAGLSMPSR